MRSVCVFCGSSPGLNPTYARAAEVLGRVLAETATTLIYGGGNVGLMGIVADATLAAGGKVIGVIPQFLVDKEVAHQGLSALHVVRDMHERKAMMAELADGFMALPGGIGTLEELFEIWTWAQLGQHHKPIALLNTAGFYDALLVFLDQLVTERFVRAEQRDLLLVDTDASALQAKMAAFKPVLVGKWLDRKP